MALALSTIGRSGSGDFVRRLYRIAALRFRLPFGVPDGGGGPRRRRGGAGQALVPESVMTVGPE
jgi:hypothetical protein